MRKLSTVVLIILLQLTLCVGLGSAAEKAIKKSQKKEVAKKETITYLNASFDPNIDKISIPFVGHDIEQVYKAFDERNKTSKKDEFETTERYQRRLEEQKKAPVYGTVGLESILAFVIAPIVEYDADSQILTISVPVSDALNSVRLDRSRFAIQIKSGETYKEKSIGQNAYGAKVNIEKTYTKNYELAIHNKSDIKTEEVIDEETKSRLEENFATMPDMLEKMKKMSARNAIVQRINIGTEKARATKGNISALILAQLTTPYSSEGALLREATFDNPTTFFAQMYYVDVNLAEIWIYDKLSGEIISKVKSKESRWELKKL